MRFDYNFGTEATFIDWERDGCDKAQAILDALEEKENQENSPSEKTNK